MAATLGLAVGLAASFVAARLLSRSSPASVMILRSGVLWALFTLLPMQLAASLEMVGLMDRISPGAVAAIQFGVCILGVGLAVVGREAAARRSIARVAWPPGWLGVSWAIVCAVGLVFLARTAVGWPDNWDGVAYHLPLALRWLQLGTLALPPESDWRFSLPGNGEIALYYMLGANLERWSGLVNLMPAAVLGAAVYRLGLMVSAHREAAQAAAIMALMLPMVAAQAFGHYVDLFGTAFTLAGAALLAEGGPKERRRDVFFAAVAFGVALGTKPVFIVYVGILVAGPVVVALAARRYNVVALLVLGAALTSGFWYGRAIAYSGNPVFPLQVKIGDLVVLHGVPTEAITPRDFDREFVEFPLAWFAHPWREWKRNVGLSGVSYGVSTGLGPLFATFVVVGSMFYLWNCRRRAGSARIWIALFVLLGVLTWAVFLRRMPRFGLPVWGMACAVTSELMSRLLAHRRRGVVALWFLPLSFAAVLIAADPLFETGSTVRWRRFARSDYYLYPPWIDGIPPGSRVVNCSGHNNMLPAGSSLATIVIPDFLVPGAGAVSDEWLYAQRADYVLESLPRGEQKPRCLGSTSLELDQSSVVGSGQQARVWQLWRVRVGRPADGDLATGR